MRLAFAFFFAAASFAVPALAGAVDIPATTHVLTTPAPVPVPNRVIAPEIKVPPTSAPVTGPPQNPSTPTLWLQPQIDHQLILSNISESMTPYGSKGCMQFSISASLNAADAITLLGVYSKNENLVKANVYAPPIRYELVNASIKSYSESDGPSGASVKLTLTEQRFNAVTGTGASTASISGC
jgi:hypothetical protein